MDRLRTSLKATVLAPLLVAIDDRDQIALLRFLDPRDPDPAAERLLAALHARGATTTVDARACAPAVAAVREFLAGRTRRLALRAAPAGTGFQRAVWRVVARVPYGRTITYRELAERVGRPTAWRAVARANATNPVALVVPCHRVVGSDGSATGYDAGIAVKQALLDLEGRHRARSASGPPRDRATRR